MFTRYRSQCFILRKKDVGLADRLFTVYAKDFGKLDLLAKSVRKIQSKLRSALEVFYLSEVEFIQGKNRKTLVDAVLLDGFSNLRKDLTRLFVVDKIAEVFDSMVRGQEADEKLWHLLSEVFYILDSKEIKAEQRQLVYHYFIWNFLAILGYKPDLYHCSSCHNLLKPGSIYFNLTERALLCSVCCRKLERRNLLLFPVNTVKIIRLLLRRDWSLIKRLRLGAKDFDSLKIVSDSYLREIK
jgi:DNA repair protein RecO (recombination protein O)